MRTQHWMILVVVLASSGIGWRVWSGRNNPAPSDKSDDRSPLSPVDPLNLTKGDYTGDPWFEDATDQSGIDFLHSSGSSKEKPFPSANGSGVAALDYDLDGQYDLYFATGRPFPLSVKLDKPPANRVFRNLGDWKFEDVSLLTGLDHSGYSAGVTVGDYDQDGFPDVYVACYGENVLYRNQGDGTYVAMPDTGTNDPQWATSAAMLDYDNDGLTDIYVCNYGQWTWETNQYCGDRLRGIRVHCGPASIEAQPDVLLRNQGDGTFVDVSVWAGIRARSARSQGIVVADFNEDGRVDFYVGNDLHANSLFLNQGDGTFTDESEGSGVAYDFKGVSQAGMGVAAADLTGNGRLELLVTNFENEHNAYYESLGRGMFAEVAHSRGLAAASMPWVGWGVGFADFNLDGWPDVIVTNGHVDDNRHLMGQTSPYASPGLVWVNTETNDHVRRFKLLGSGAGDYFKEQHVGRALVLVDLDNDGDQDVVIGHQDALPALLRNVGAGEQPRSITVHLVGVRGNRDAIGAKLTWKAGQRTVVQQVTHGGSYLSSHDPRLVFAVLNGEEEVSLTIDWPSGLRSALDGLNARQSYVLTEPDETTASPDRTSPTTIDETSESKTND